MAGTTGMHAGDTLLLLSPGIWDHEGQKLVNVWDLDLGEDELWGFSEETCRGEFFGEDNGVRSWDIG